MENSSELKTFPSNWQELLLTQPSTEPEEEERTRLNSSQDSNTEQAIREELGSQDKGGPQGDDIVDSQGDTLEFTQLENTQVESTQLDYNSSSDEEE